MAHTAKLLTDPDGKVLIRKHGPHSLSVVIRVDDDPATDTVLPLHHADNVPTEDVERFIQHHLNKAAQKHAQLSERAETLKALPSLGSMTGRAE